jgi:hypothetical protein
VQLLQAWREHRRLKSTLPLPRPAFNRQFFAAALARLKNIANALYAACEVRHACALPCMGARHLPACLTCAAGRVLVDGRPSPAQQDARSRHKRVSALFFLAAGLAASAAAARVHRHGAPRFAQILVHYVQTLGECVFSYPYDVSVQVLQFSCAFSKKTDTNRYDVAFVISMVPIASAGMNLMRPWPGASVTCSLSLSRSNFKPTSSLRPACSCLSSHWHPHQRHQHVLQIQRQESGIRRPGEASGVINRASNVIIPDIAMEQQ